MTYVGKAIFQGDLAIVPIDAIPQGAKRADPPADGKIVLAHSETGHNHVIDVRERPENVDFLVHPTDGLIAYLDVIRADVAVEHLRSFDTHAPVTIPVGKYEVRRQREYEPQGWRRVAD